MNLLISTRSKYSLEYTYKKGPSWPVTVNALDDDRRALLLSMRKSLPHMAVYEAFALPGKTILEDMSGLSREEDHFTASLLLTELHLPMSLNIYGRRSPFPVLRRRSILPAFVVSSNRSTRPASKAAVPTQTIITPKKPTNYKYRVDAADFVQRAWVQAINFDATIIVFDCENYFRVGVRHRKTQTLFISDLVDASSTDPAYGKVITAINIAIIRDAMDRTPLLDPSLRKNKPSSHSTSRKRPHDRDEIVSVRRSHRMLGEPNKEVEPEASLIGWAKAAGSSSRKHSYRYNECLTLVLGRKLGQGAVGEAYEASLEIDFGDGNIAHYPDKVIVKLAFSERQTERLRHEYGIYRHLSEGPMQVTKIPRAFGFFEDVESEAGALILDHAGVALAYRLKPPGTGVAVSAEERATYIEILTSIHEAGVAHGDIRSWNLVEDKKGGYFIADFDRANLRGSRYQMAAKQERLALLLGGENIDDFSVTSYPVSS
ncbi:hypothetical protein IW261DRAFT_1616814 [Armillaria novae-zelandiae]|uniref:Protein kinase domain-containing protein n=1 Tax=Armillaria novae-zelandiae TaxID=153914 RepID=A0AA39PVA7_9AGAR|nr:hypothetical protein IW261DRAFT_1616814 [Armillaria novae-zelandiae]